MFSNNQELEHIFDHIDLRVILDADLYEHITTKIKKSKPHGRFNSNSFVLSKWSPLQEIFHDGRITPS